MDEYTVYVHIDPEGKRYYGATKMDVNKRWKKGYNKYFTEAIEKYGWDNIQHTVVAKALTKEEAYWLEIELIKAFNTTNSDKGYNIAKGGLGSNGLKHHTESAKKKISEAMSGENHPMYGKHGKNNPMSKPVICLTTKRVFYSVSEGAKYYEIKTISNITSCCQGKRKSAGKLNGQKLVWKYLYLETL